MTREPSPCAECAEYQEAERKVERLRAALDKICGIALGDRTDPNFPSAKVHKIVLEALEPKP